MSKILKNVDKLYRVRFSTKERDSRDKIWKVLCSNFLQKFIKKSDTVLDLAAGYCNFINNIEAQEKLAIDLNPETKKFASQNVKVYECSVTDLPKNMTSKIDIVFAGCLMEHLSSKEEIFNMFLEVKRILKPGGLFLILNPNIRFSTSDYWDYFDHLVPISDRSAVEGLELAGFKIKKVIPRFVPNTVKDALPKSPLLVSLYLKLPFLFPIFGRQMFIVAQNPTL